MAGEEETRDIPRGKKEAKGGRGKKKETCTEREWKEEKKRKEKRKGENKSRMAGFDRAFSTGIA